MKNNKCPRVAIAGLSGDSGKTFLTCGLAAAARQRGLKVAAFKKGPDYIDSAWLRIASGNEARNLDTFMMSHETIEKSFVKHSADAGISILEGNRGLFDGFDEKGSHSTAELAKLLNIPLILIFSIKKMTRTSAAIILGCKELDKKLNIAGVVLNRVAGKRHLKVAKNAIENETGIPVLGAIPNLGSADLFPSRHLGLITPGEYEAAEKSVEMVRSAIEGHIDISGIIEIANKAPDISCNLNDKLIEIKGGKLRIAYFRDKAFSFYYPENLEALENRGAELIPVSSISDKQLPDIDGLYIGGGFPESNIEEIVQNRELMASVKNAAENGLPIYAECGGLIYLCDSIEMDANSYPLAGIFSAKMKMFEKPQGHGYATAAVETENPFYRKGLQLSGHEFHYSKIITEAEKQNYCLKMTRGKGASGNMDGLIYKNVFAAYLHIHANSGNDWADGFINCALKYKKTK